MSVAVDGADADERALPTEPRCAIARWLYAVNAIGGMCAAGVAFALGEQLRRRIEADPFYGARSDAELAEVLATSHWIRLCAWAALATIVIAHVFWIWWVREAWSAIPASLRIARLGADVTPLAVALRLLVPIYGMYWVFVAFGGLCDVVDRELERLGSRARTSRGIVTLASLTQAIGLLVIAPFLWLCGMSRIELGIRVMRLARSDEPASPPMLTAPKKEPTGWD